MKEAVIIDIDGTLANISHRRPMLERFPVRNEDGLIIKHTKPDWNAFNEAIEHDTPNHWCVRLVQSLETETVFESPIDIIFLSGRAECYRDITEKQINSWVGGNYELYMRPSKDYRPDTEIKEEIYNNEIKDKYNVLFCVDDRACVVKQWRKMGIVCLQCDEGDF